jgi:hypothetical protein
MSLLAEPGLIQVSQETADLLVCGGKPHWVTPREDKIHAKGKEKRRNLVDQDLSA